MNSMNFNFPRFEPLRMRNWQASLPSAYGASLDIEERLLQVLNFCNDIGLLTNQMSNNWNQLLAWIKTNGLDDYVKSTLSEWIADGTFDKIINVTVFNKLNKKIDDCLFEVDQMEKDIKDFEAYVRDLISKFTDNFQEIYTI